MSEKKSTKRVGRPRSTEAQKAILEATWKLLKTMSVRDLSIEAIAREAGVGKTTIYRWWPTKAAVVIDAFMAKITPENAPSKVRSAKSALQKQITSLIETFTSEQGHIVAQIIAEGQSDDRALKMFRDRFLLNFRETTKTLIEQGIKAGEFDKKLDPELSTDILHGSLYYRLLVGHLPIDDDFAKNFPEQALKCFQN
ncbi:MAG: TetR/AcrR family transcriptional regulator [Xenococcaceae cyanobacterium]